LIKQEIYCIISNVIMSTETLQTFPRVRIPRGFFNVVGGALRNQISFLQGDAEARQFIAPPNKESLYALEAFDKSQSINLSAPDVAHALDGLERQSENYLMSARENAGTIYGLAARRHACVLERVTHILRDDLVDACGMSEVVIATLSAEPQEGHEV
jgi:hypothetical protein